LDWSYFFFSELLFFVLFLAFFIWQHLSLKKDKAMLKAKREAQALADKGAHPGLSAPVQAGLPTASEAGPASAVKE